MSYRLLSSLAKSKWLIEPSYAEGYYPLVVSLLTGKDLIQQSLTIEQREEKTSSNVRIAPNAGLYFVSDYGSAAAPERAPENSIAVIQIQQVITKYDQECGPSGTLTKMNLIKRCANNPNIKAIVLYCDSGGGEADGTEQFANTIASAVKTKPVLAFIDGMAASAMYWMVANCTEVIANLATAEIGSIGTYLSFADLRPAFEKQGIVFHDIYATKSTEKNKPIKDALQGKYDSAREMIDVINEAFIGGVKSGRSGKLNLSAGDPFKGKLFFANEAKTIGLIDSIGTWEYCIKRADELSKNSSANHSNTNSNNTMFNLFGEKFKALNAIGDVKPEALTAEQLSAANEELANNKITSVKLVSTADDTAKAAKITQLEQDLAAANTAKTAAEADATKWKAKAAEYGAKDGADLTDVNKQADETQRADENKNTRVKSDTEKKRDQLIASDNFSFGTKEEKK